MLSVACAPAAPGIIASATTAARNRPANELNDDIRASLRARAETNAIGATLQQRSRLQSQKDAICNEWAYDAFYRGPMRRGAGRVSGNVPSACSAAGMATM